MIRKLLIVCCTLAAIVSAAVAWLSYFGLPTTLDSGGPVIGESLTYSYSYASLTSDTHIFLMFGDHWNRRLSVRVGNGRCMVDYSKTLGPTEAARGSLHRFAGVTVDRGTKSGIPIRCGMVLNGISEEEARYLTNLTLPSSHVVVSAPFWVHCTLAVLFATYPTIALIRGPVRRWRRRRKGLCPHCGYNLTGNVTGVCSECGEQM